MKEDGWKWIGGASMPPIDIEPSHQAAVSQLEIKKNPPTNCVFLNNNNKLQDEDCNNNNPLKVCTIGYGTVGLGASIGKYF